MAKGFRFRSFGILSISSIALDDHRDIFTAFGGHAGAAGMTLPEENLGQLSDILCNYVYDNDIDTSTKNTLNLDEERSTQRA